MPGRSIWHTYLFDPDGHSNELIHASSKSAACAYKPRNMYNIGFKEPPPLPQISELSKPKSISNGADLLSGFRHVEPLPETFDVDGILGRLFRFVAGWSIFLLRIFESAELFYRDALGLTLTEEVICMVTAAYFSPQHARSFVSVVSSGSRGGFGNENLFHSAALGLQLAGTSSPTQGCRKIFSPDRGAQGVKINPVGNHVPASNTLLPCATLTDHPALLRDGANRLAGPNFDPRIEKAAGN